MKGTAPRALLALLMCALFVPLVAGCGSRSGAADQVEPSSPSVNAVEQQSNSAARRANLRTIDAAAQAYYAENGIWPTDIGQLSRYFSRGVPTDPLGGTYYLVNQGGEVSAAVR